MGGTDANGLDSYSGTVQDYYLCANGGDPGFNRPMGDMAAPRNVGGHIHGRRDAAIKVGDMWVCDWHRICAFGHDWVGLGPRGWTDDSNDSNRHGNVNRARRPGRVPCKIGDPHWANDCR